jgi:hypothetical protein
MKLDLDKVPSTLDEAVDMVVVALEPEDMEFIKSHEAVDAHHTVGRGLRNAWSLWDKETVLVQWFKENYKIFHADDLSGVILSSVWAKVRGEKYDIQADITEFHEHWKRQGVDPETGETLEGPRW